MDVAFGSAHVTATGGTTVLVMCALGIIAAVLFSGWRIEQSTIRSHDHLLTILTVAREHQMTEHERINRNQDILVCMAQLSPAETLGLRRNFSDRALEVLCPWISTAKPLHQERKSP